MLVVMSGASNVRRHGSKISGLLQKTDPCVDSMRTFMEEQTESEECASAIPGLSCESVAGMFAGQATPDTYTAPLTEACCKKTPYDVFMERVPGTCVNDLGGLLGGLEYSDSALYVIDMQNDFVGTKENAGSFRLPCNKEAQEYAERVGKFTEQFAANGGKVMFSLDYHPKTHCSFDGSCKNLDTNGESGNPSEPNYSPNKGRYLNAFPPHCLYECASGEVCKPSEDGGARMHDRIRNATKEIKNGDMAVLYKGFHEDYESFAAIKHSIKDMAPTARDAELTGGWALKNWKQKPMPDDSNRPTAAQFSKPEGDMVSASTILEDWGVKNLFVIGLVFDFCVGETAMYAKATGIENVVVIADLTRPAVDGKPNVLPPVPAAGEDGASMGKEAMGILFGASPGDGNPLSGAKLSTGAHMKKVQDALEKTGVCVLKTQDQAEGLFQPVDPLDAAFEAQYKANGRFKSTPKDVNFKGRKRSLSAN